MKLKHKKFIWIIVAVMATGISAVTYYWSTIPSGHFASYSILAHDSWDVLTFSDGLVTWQSCCGDEEFGTFKETADHRWVWTWTSKKKKILTYVLEPGVFRITCVDTNSPSKSFTLRRRIFARLPL